MTSSPHPSSPPPPPSPPLPPPLSGFLAANSATLSLYLHNSQSPLLSPQPHPLPPLLLVQTFSPLFLLGLTVGRVFVLPRPACASERM